MPVVQQEDNDAIGYAPNIRKMQIEGYRRMSAADKIRAVREMNRCLENLALAEMKRRYPNADAQECCLRMASRYLDAETMLKVLGWNIQDKGY